MEPQLPQFYNNLDAETLTDIFVDKYFIIHFLNVVLLWENRDVMEH
jgi:hypothetical protein